MSAAVLQTLGWCWVDVNTWRNDKYPGTFTYREACEKEQAT